MQNLNEILKANPWTGVIAEWEGMLKRGKPGTKFTLHGDEALVDASDDKLHTELPPQPFIGDPRAPIWLLFKNPSYCDLDRYDFLEPTKAERGAHAPHRPQALANRQHCLLQQFKLEKNASFYPLDDAFATVPLQGAANKGTHNWWYSRLRWFAEYYKANHFPIFVIEAFPYHESDGGKVNQHLERYRASKHCLFWEKMVRWALSANSGKVVVIRPSIRNVVQRVVPPEMLARALTFSSKQCVHVSPNNVCGNPEARDLLADKKAAWKRIEQALSTHGWKS